ncbi:MAG TPA: peptidoglycan bridge formation glycyltransferase FemA/FemB family protein [Lentimicrobium sp.]|jgi:lipid II:glycine glycyltransferase (peptidoglycan interpeptide bridge formation enzyme)|nr:peptidoglycan bridge formation glycyltransferase FemA/FemB family protein [Lentimicrobium sp.]
MEPVKVSLKKTKEIVPTGILQQTAFWAKFKHKTGWYPLAFDIFEPDPQRFGFWSHNGDILILLKETGQEGVIAYAPYGPEIVPDEELRGLWLESLSEALKPFLPERCLNIRYDLEWPSLWTGDETEWPETPLQEMRFNMGTSNWNLKKAPTNILPSNTVVLPLDRDPDELLMDMKSKTRYNIRLSARKNINVRIADASGLDEWYRLYNNTVQRNHIVSEKKDYFRQVLSTQAEETISPAEITLLLAEYQGEPLAGMFLAFSGDRATYLYGASASHHRDMMAPYLLQWNAILMSREKGCTEYDLFGISGKADPSHPMYGLYRFKTGFGGIIKHRMGCWDYPLNREAYERFRINEMVSAGFHVRV